VANFCELRGIEVYLPCRKVWREWSDRKKLLQEPLFPSYVFLRFHDEPTKSRAAHAPGFLWYVRTQHGMAQVDESELAGVRQMLSSGLEFDPLPGTDPGDPVEIISGPLQGCRGWLERKQAFSLVLRISAINGAVRVHIPDATRVRAIAGGQLRCGERGADHN